MFPSLFLPQQTPLERHFHLCYPHDYREVYPNFSDEALNKFLDAANGDVSKVISSSSIYNGQKAHIKYPESWIIACIKDWYYEKKSNKPAKKIDHGFKGRDYDWDKLETELFNQNL